ncbi:hypothetical protein CALCODRAFT_519945, partial [Calocera cornea HHB12733]
QNVSNTDIAWIDNVTARYDTQSSAGNAARAYVIAYNVDVAAPAQLFFPSAGGILILAALLAIFRTHGIPADERKQPVPHGFTRFQKSIGRSGSFQSDALAVRSQPWKLVLSL